MRSFSWEIFIRAIPLFFVTKLVNNKNHQEERRNRENTHPSMLFEQCIAIIVKKSIKAAKDAVEPSGKAMEISTSEVGGKETVSVVTGPKFLGQNLSNLG